MLTTYALAYNVYLMTNESRIGPCHGDGECSECAKPPRCENCGNDQDELTFVDADDEGIKFCSRKCRTDWAVEVEKSEEQAAHYGRLLRVRPMKPVTVPGPITDEIAPLGPEARAMLLTCRTADLYSPRVCGLRHGHDGDHVDPSLPTGQTRQLASSWPHLHSTLQPTGAESAVDQRTGLSGEREAVQRVNHGITCGICGGTGRMKSLNGGYERCFPCDGSGVRPQPSPRPAVARVLDIVRTVIRARRQVCYGALSIGDEQLDELARAIVTNIAAEIAGGE